MGATHAAPSALLAKVNLSAGGDRVRARRREWATGSSNVSE